MLTAKDNFIFSIFSNNKLVFCKNNFMSKPKRTENNGEKFLQSITNAPAGIVVGSALRLVLLQNKRTLSVILRLSVDY